MILDKIPVRRISTLGIVFAILSFAILPIVFGTVAVILGSIAYLRGDTKRGLIAIALGVVSLIIVFIGALSLGLLFERL